MRDRVLDKLVEAEASYVQQNPKSRDSLRELGRWLPGGDTRSTTWFAPFPMVIERASGAWLVDLDGHRLIDFLCNYTSLVHGHAPQVVNSAIGAILDSGIAFAAPLQEQGELAQRLVDRIGAAELIRFTNSGTEANLLAARIARKVTGRRRLAVARHSYHGSWDSLDWHAAASTGTTVFEVNDAEGTEAALGNARDLAAIFVEPVLGSGGVIPLTREYLTFLRAFAHDHGALLVFDEVMTFRLGYGGRQETLGVTPDLTTLGKVIGGGIPIGAVAGPARVMEITDPRSQRALSHGGTFNGNRLAMVAGAAALDAFDRGEVERINRLGERLQAGIGDAASTHQLPISVTGCGSLMNIHASSGVATPDDAEAAAEQPLKRLIHLTLLMHGVFAAPRGELCVSTPMDDGLIDRALASVSAAFAEIADPYT